MPIRKTEFPIIRRNINDIFIALRLTDGYINATALCEAYDKELEDYTRLKATNEFMKELSREIETPISQLMQPFESSNSTIKGVWVHPLLAINLAQWVSPQLGIVVPQWVFLWMSEQSVEPKESSVKEETPKNKFDDYDPEFGKMIDKALAYDPRKKKKAPKK